MICLIVQSYETAKRIQDLTTGVYIIVVDRLRSSSPSLFNRKYLTIRDKVEDTYLLFTFSIINEEIVRNLQKEYSFKRIIIPNYIIRKYHPLSDLVEVSDEELTKILLIISSK